MKLRIDLCCMVLSMVLVGTLWNPIMAQQPDKQPLRIEKVKVDVGRLGVGEKAKAKITLKNGTKVKGYISEVREENFVLRDQKTDAPTTIAYTEVVKVERNRGHSTARNIAIGIGIGVGAFLAIVAITLAHLD